MIGFFDVCVVGKYVASYDSRHPHKILSQNERSKKEKYLEACLERRYKFTPIVFSVDRLMGGEKKVATKKMATDMSKKWDRE